MAYSEEHYIDRIERVKEALNRSSELVDQWQAELEGILPTDDRDAIQSCQYWLNFHQERLHYFQTELTELKSRIKT
jgi:hypothetical protein